MLKEKIGAKLTSLRLERNLTQKETAIASGLSLRCYQNYERGLREPTVSNLLALAEHYAISLDELVNDSVKTLSSQK